MNCFLHLRFSFLLVIIICSTMLQAQIVDDNAYLQGTYVEVGVNGCGAFASSTTPPAGYVVTGLSGLNFIADSDMDGWDIGTPGYCGDYAIPGSPVEGWGIQIDGSNYYNTDQYCSSSSISGGVTSYSDDGDSVVVVWEGEVAGVVIIQRSVLYTDNLYFVTKVTLINSSGADLSDIYYRRNIDPDNENLATGSFTTINTIEANPVLGDPYSIVTGVGETYGCYLALVANNVFSSASYGNFGTTAGTYVSDSYNGFSGYSQSGSITADQAVQISFLVSNLPADASTTFAFAYVFSEDAIDEALEETFIVSDEPVDVGVIDIVTPSSGCGLGSETVTIKLFNFGYEAQSDIPVSYRLDGGSILTETFTGTIDPGTFGEHTFGASADLSAIALHEIEAWTSQPGDVTYYNDTSNVDINNIPVIASYPYYQDFEAGAGGWEAGGTASSWELGTPASAIINTAPPATPLSVNSWKTDLDGVYFAGENSYVLGPCFDFTTLEQPYVELDYWVETYPFYGYDGIRLEYSLDAGGSWTSVNYLTGAEADAENWYNDGCYAFDPFSFPYDSAWTRASGGWLTAHHDISNLAGESQVQFRIHFATSFFSFYDGAAFDNFRIQDPFAHDLEMTALVAPVSMPALSASELVTVNVTNVGLSTETDFDVFYQLDGGPPQVTSYAGVGIAYGESANIDFLVPADLGIDGCYDFKIWTSMVTDEYHLNDTLYKTVCNLEPVSGDAAYYLYSNIYGGSEPWFTTTNSAAMDAVFGTGEWTTDFYETLDPAIVFGLGTCFIFMEGGDAMADELETFLTANAEAVQNWVASGGHLFLNSAPNEGDGMDFLFDGVSLDYSWYAGSAEATDPAHPIFNYYFTPTGTSWTGGSFSHAAVSGGDITPLIHDFYNPDKIILAEKEWGAGKILFGGMTPNAFHSPALEAANLRASIIQYLAICALADIDLGVLGITDPNDGCDLGLSTVTIKIANYGFEDQTSIPVFYQVDGASPVSETYTGTILSGDIADYTFFTPAAITTGPHTIYAWTAMPGDLIVSNDSTDKLINSHPIIAVYPYYEDFEDGASNWFSYGSNNTWELGEPIGPVISGAPPETPGSLNSWATDLDDFYYFSGENSFLQGPCYDFSTLIAPYVEFDLWYHGYGFTGYGYDGINMQYSLDAGDTWEIVDYALGDDNENWYNAINYNWYDPITFSYDSAWCGSSGGWIHVKHDIAALAGESSVQFRFRFGTATWTSSYDGAAIDNINIQDPYANDLGVTAIISPEPASVDYTSTETVSVTIENHGTLAQDDFDVSYQVDGGTIVTESYSGIAIDPGADVTFNFTTTTSALAADGIHNICAWTELAGDEDISNDTTCTDILNLSPVSGTGAYMIYSNYSGYEPNFGSEYGSAMDDVFGSGSWTLDYFETVDPFTVFNEDNCFIYLNGASDHGTELKAFLENNIDLVQAWVESGGNLLLNAGQYEITDIDLGFDGVGMTNYYYSYNATAVDATHPIFVGPFTPVNTEYDGDFLGYGQLSGDYTLIFEEDFSGYDLIAEKNWGEGKVMFSQLYSPQYWFYAPTEGQNMHRNMIDYLKLCAPVDVGVTDLLSPESGCGLGTDEEITIEITNFGPTSVTDIPVNYTIDGGGLVSETYVGTIESGASDTYTFVDGGDFSVADDHLVEVWTSFSGDGDAANDLYTATITTFETPLVDLGPNVTICDEHIIDAGNPGSTYAWSTGATTQTIVVT
ncbi:MAG: hypothetical protein H7Y00_09905, partial [Fimbriimonadaceae bacterium]|nr:hypothetical protein [Chitinophagales bacterium]